MVLNCFVKFSLVTQILSMLLKISEKSGNSKNFFELIRCHHRGLHQPIYRLGTHAEEELLKIN